MAQLHEHQAKDILAAHRIEIPRGAVAFAAGAARKIAEKLGGSVVVKAQIHSTSRAAAGGIRFANSADEAEKISAEMLGREIAGNLCEAVLIDEKADIVGEFYLGFIIDTALKRPTLLFSATGGSGIEQRAGSMQKMVCSIRREPTIEEIKSICGDEKIAGLLQKLYRAAKSCEARTAEINPLAQLKDGRLVALDARISVDDYAVFRHEDLGIEMARELGHTPTSLEKIAWEAERDDFRGTFYFVEILEKSGESGESGESSELCESGEFPVKAFSKALPDSVKSSDSIDSQDSQDSSDSFRIGFHGAGGGGSMASLDAAQRNGLQPACYVDTSGNPPASKVYRAARIILSIPGIKGYFLSGSGVASQEQFGLARAVLKAFLEVKPNIPAVLRLGGNGEEYAKELVEKYAKFLPAPMEAYQKNHPADFCAARLKELIESGESRESSESNESVESGESGKSPPETSALDPHLERLNRLARLDRLSGLYSFKTRTGEVIFDHAVFAEKDATPVVEACQAKILKLDKKKLPVLAITREEAEKGKCTECLACEFASWEYETGGVKIDLPIEGLS